MENSGRVNASWMNRTEINDTSTIFRSMNSTINGSLVSLLTCSLQKRVYTPSYLFLKLVNATYLRVLVVPGLILNILCLIILSRPRLSNKSTTIVFLRFLAIFDIMAVFLKFVRAEINYQSLENFRDISLLVPSVCKTLYIFMNASISIAMWTIVLMSLDKAVAISYPLKASIWLTHKRAFYTCCITIVILLLANIPFIKFSGIRISRNGFKYCGLIGGSFVVDLLTASILPMGLITAANIIITVVLHRTSFNWRDSVDFSTRTSETSVLNQHISKNSFRQRCSGGSTTATTADLATAHKRRTNTQVTRMLLAVTISLIICNIPNTILSVAFKIYDTRQILIGRLCIEVSDHQIELYKLGFYSTILQDILSDLPHIVNFFLYCLAGKKFRSIFIAEVTEYLARLHIIKPAHKSFPCGTYVVHFDTTPTLGYSLSKTRQSSALNRTQGRRSVEVLLNGNKTRTTITPETAALLKNVTCKSNDNSPSIASNTTR